MGLMKGKHQLTMSLQCSQHETNVLLLFCHRLPGTDLTISPGVIVQAPVWTIHHDPRHWPDPEAFIPDRFLPENKANINSFAHMPFGMGPRNCLGEDPAGVTDLLNNQGIFASINNFLGNQ